MRLAPIFALATFTACGQDVVAPPCAGHDASIAADAAINSDATTPDATQADSGPACPADAAPLDAGGCEPYCLTGLTASSTRANVRELVRLTPMVDNPSATSLTFSVRPSEIVAARLPGRPALVLSEITLDFSIDPGTGAATFRVAEVPPWFIATTFTLRVHAKGPGASDPDRAFDVDIHVRGNLVFSGEYSDVSRVYAVASDGRPARATQAMLTRGELITQLARKPSAVVMSHRGSLLVLDTGAAPQRVLRFELSGHDQQLTTFALADANMAPYLTSGSTYVHSMVELPDGRVGVNDYSFSRAQKSRLVLWNADGSYDRTLNSPDPNAIWTGVAAGPGGEVLVTRLDGGGSVLRFDPNTGEVLGVFADALPSSPRSALTLPSGAVYIGGDGYIVRITGAQRSLVMGLPGTSSANWWGLAAFDQGRVLATDDERGEAVTPVILEGNRVTGPFRLPGMGNVGTQVIALTYLE